MDVKKSSAGCIYLVINSRSANPALAELVLFTIYYDVNKLISIRPQSLPIKMMREAAGKMTKAVKTAQRGWRKPAISSRNSNTSNAYRKRFPPEYNIEHWCTDANLGGQIHRFTTFKQSTIYVHKECKMLSRYNINTTGNCLVSRSQQIIKKWHSRKPSVSVFSVIVTWNRQIRFRFLDRMAFLSFLYLRFT